MEVLSTFIGFVVGLIAAGIAVELGLKKLFAPPDQSKLTTIWSLSELQSPEVVATSLSPAVEVPATARIVTAENVPPPVRGVQIRRNAAAKGSFALDAQKPRALLFLGGIEPGSLALWTVDEKLIDRLRSEFNRLWTRSTDYVERAKVAQIADKPNVTIETTGMVQDIIPYKGRFLMRLTEAGEAVGVLVDQDLPVRGHRVTVKGIVRPSSSGYALVEA
ncbi:MAG TPA: hypothetical protein VI818_05870, partial [Candidatus Thermoplasmatota archaeon]|nr:hypothetical protein [Candidatus Thermoplasmatota archaeon]